MQAQGIRLPDAPKDAFDPIWCAWGYGRAFTPVQVFETLPVVKQLGFGWAVLDDGWQVALGDWRPRPDKFPAGDADMKALVDRIHAAGLKAQLWWAPLGADPGSRTEREHPDWLLRNADGSTRKISWWDSQYLCPAVDGVRADAAAFVKKAIGEWGFDGLKIDGQHLNAAPECFNPAHHHATPAAAPEGLPGFFKAIWESAQATKPGAVIEICPCGTGYSFFTLPYLNMTVASDPGELLADPHEGQDDQGARGRPHCLLRRPRRDERRRRGLRLDLRRRRRDRDEFRLAGRAGREGQASSSSRRSARSSGRDWVRLYEAQAPVRGRVPSATSTTSASTGPRRTRSAKDGALYYAFFAAEVRRNRRIARPGGRPRLRGPGLRERRRARHGQGTGRELDARSASLLLEARLVEPTRPRLAPRSCR